MFNATALKYWWRSGSTRFTLDRHPSARSRPLSKYEWQGKPVYYRPGTSDTELIYKILLKAGRKAEYYFPSALQPRMILDIGANIGVTSVYLAHRFPDARIYSFEPVPANVELLRLNVAAYPRITVFPMALGAADGDVELHFSDHPHNFGGFSFSHQGSDCDRKLRVQRRNIRTVLNELRIDRVDLIKIDTEGAEYEILTAFDQDVLRRVTWITGELHGEKDFELLAFLSRWFDIETKRSIGKRLFMFAAANKSSLPLR